ncbi:hypothetical protein AOLI_G00007430 [Acnodon oligacanthus]
MTPLPSLLCPSFNFGWLGNTPVTPEASKRMNVEDCSVLNSCAKPSFGSHFEPGRKKHTFVHTLVLHTPASSHAWTSDDQAPFLLIVRKRKRDGKWVEGENLMEKEKSVSFALLPK